MNASQNYRLYQQLNASMSTAAEELGKSPIELECLVYVAEQPEQTTTTREMFDGLSRHRKAKVSTSACNLFRERLLDMRIPREGPQKNKIITLTPAGRELYGQFMRYFADENFKNAESEGNSQ
jgi:DNA-binding MarR family transcriptional regulator